MKIYKEEIKDVRFRWIVGGIGWPNQQQKIAGYVCLVGTVYPSGYERPRYFLIAESESRDIKDLCQDVLSLDFELGPEIWLADRTNDAALAVLHNQNEKVRQVLAGKSYEMGRSPLHRRMISVSQSPLFEMSNGIDFIISRLSELLTEQRLILPMESMVLKNLKLDRGESLTWEERPVLTALGICVSELERIAENEKSRQNQPTRKESIPDRLKKYRVM